MEKYILITANDFTKIRKISDANIEELKPIINWMNETKNGKTSNKKLNGSEFIALFYYMPDEADSYLDITEIKILTDLEILLENNAPVV